MYDLEETIFKKLDLLNVWIFITEKCNLNCDYCFFKDRKGKRTISINQILHLLEKLPKNKRYDFVISGGEPLLCWNLTKRLIGLLKKKYPHSEVTLQTNMFFLSKKRIDFLKEKDIVIEPGIDGDFSPNFRHRKGFTRNNFKKCLKNLNLVVENKLRMNPTMTVHPQEVEYMFTNFERLISLGLNSIEVHPAFLADWKNNQAKIFIKQYKKILEYEKDKGSYLVCKEYSFPLKNFSLDLVIQPDGFILPNWTYLAFSYKLRSNFFIMRLFKNKITILRDNLRKCLLRLKDFFKIKRTYREFSNFNASCILKYIEDTELKKRFLNYKKLCERIQKIDRLFLKRKKVL